MAPNPVEELDISERLEHDLNLTPKSEKKNKTHSPNGDFLSTFSPIPGFVRDGNCHLPSSQSPISCSPRRTLFESYWKKEGLVEGKINACINNKNNNTSERSISPLNLTELSPSPKGNKTLPRSILRRSVSEKTPKNFEKPSNLRRSKSASIRSMKSVESSNRYKGCLGLPPSLLHFMSQHRDVHFDPFVSVVEYQGDDDESQHASQHQSRLWFTEKELEKFRADAIFQTRKCPFNREFDAVKFKGARQSRALFTHQALRATPEEALISDGSCECYTLLQQEIQNILIVDSNEQSKYTLKRSMLVIFPHASVHTAKSSESAIQKVLKLRKSCQSGFDIIIVEERLGTYNSEPIRLFDQSREEAKASFHDNMSGSKLLEKLTKVYEQLTEVDMPSPTSTISLTLDIKIPLLIGFSTCLGEDGEKLTKSGAGKVFH